jgi:lysozyme family protein
MDRNFAKALKLVLKYEGGYVNHPNDPGGPTNKGITLATYRRYINSKGTVENLKAITDQQVAKVYRKQYWDAVKGDDLPDGVDFAAFDFAVNSGPGRSAKFLQAVVGATVDGKIGPVTIAAVKAKPATEVITDLIAKRLRFLKALKTWKTFGRGWSARVASVQKEAMAMTLAPPVMNVYNGYDDLVIEPVVASEMPKKEGFWSRLLGLFK